MNQPMLAVKAKKKFVAKSYEPASHGRRAPITNSPPCSAIRIRKTGRRLKK